MCWRLCPFTWYWRNWMEILSAHDISAGPQDSEWHNHEDSAIYPRNQPTTKTSLHTTILMCPTNTSRSTLFVRVHSIHGCWFGCLLVGPVLCVAVISIPGRQAAAWEKETHIQHSSSSSSANASVCVSYSSTVAVVVLLFLPTNSIPRLPTIHPYTPTNETASSFSHIGMDVGQTTI